MAFLQIEAEFSISHHDRFSLYFVDKVAWIRTKLAAIHGGGRVSKGECLYCIMVLLARGSAETPAL